MQSNALRSSLVTPVRGGSVKVRRDRRSGAKRCCAGRSIHVFMPDRAVGAGMPLPGARHAVGNQRRRSAGPPGNMRELTTPQSGKQGTSVSYKSRHGQIRRQHIKPKNPHTPAQMRIRSNLGRTSARWRVLTDEQRAAWSRAARETRTRRRMGFICMGGGPVRKGWAQCLVWALFQQKNAGLLAVAGHDPVA